MSNYTVFECLFCGSGGNEMECNSNPKTITDKTTAGYVIVLSNEKSVLLCDDWTYAIIPNEIISEFNLREGDKISATVIYDIRRDHWRVIKINTKRKRQKVFNELTGIIPEKPLNINKPAKFGECIAVHSKCQSGYEIIKNIHKEYNKYAKCIALVIDGREEYMTELKDIIKETYGTKAGTKPRKNIIAILWTLFKAKELCEKGKDTILIIYSFSKMLYNYNSVLMISDNTQIINNMAITDFIREVTRTKQIKDGGSLTIIGTVDDTAGHKFLYDRLQQADINTYETEDFI